MKILTEPMRDSALWQKIQRHRKKLISGFIVFSHIVGAFTSCVAIMETRTSQGAMAWAISLNTFPYLTVPAYWVFGRTNFNDYSTLRQTAFEATGPVAELIRTEYTKRGLLANPDRDTPDVLEKLVRLPYTRFNQVDLLIDGRQIFDSIFKSIEDATDYVLVQFYIVRDDQLGKQMQELLLKKASQGVRVYFLYDEIGSLGLPKDYITALTDGGIETSAFNSTKGIANRFQLNFRNHRKVVVVDGKEAFIGGINIGDEYLGKDDSVGNWRDTHVKISGPSVQFAQLSFIEDWRWAKETIPILNWEPEKSTSGTKNVLLLPSGPADENETFTLFNLATIFNAKERVWISTPYFVPDEQLMSALELAALRGVDVRVMVPKNNDSKIVDLAIHSFLEECERAGIQVFQYDNGFLHQKVMLVDETISAIGTANFDNRSFRLNFEITAVVSDRDFSRQVEAMLLNDFTYCTPMPASEVTSASLPYRFMVRTSRLFAPIL